MTGRYRACCTCFRQWLPMSSAERKCPACDPSRAVPNNTPTKRATSKPLDLSQMPDEPTLADLDAYLAGQFDE